MGEEKVDLLDCAPADAPITSDYRGLIGSLQWATTTTRPDMAFTTSQLARVQARPGQKHWAMALRAAAYLSQTADKGIWFHSCKKPQLLTFCDASLGNIPGRISADAHKDAGKSTGGHVLYLAGGAVAWSSRTQTIVATSSTESELIQTESAAKNTIVLRRILADMGHAPTAPTQILCDNQPCLDLLKDSHSATNRRSSHIERRWFKARELQEAGLIDMLKVPTHDNIADIFTKPLGRILHERFTQMLVRDEHPTPTMPVFTTPKKRKLSEV